MDTLSGDLPASTGTRRPPFQERAGSGGHTKPPCPTVRPAGRTGWLGAESGPPDAAKPRSSPLGRGVGGDGEGSTRGFENASRDGCFAAMLSPAPREAIGASSAIVDAAQRRAAPFRSVDFAAGEADGVRCRADRGRPTKYLLVGRDDYAAGFRAGYFRAAAPRAADAVLAAGERHRDRFAAIMPNDPKPHRRDGPGAEHASTPQDTPDAA